ncbi:3'(2'),5'-bisphosphate nucleotidase CysQ [Shewanella gelidii]|uniref:3'(2'),5'-bisphosphate nucleotidase CysQ n=1 Tax=Shewanella gelidii TaxID=1642821 RepID=A0A917JHF6_9GAMM|nr:3'(2'),5'-bisphosphate nucleotidase CysQ [Shewanella gelidii]GGI67121.1 3'(2'),5'-bisphosphate nucleotidase CysQ [Shewanella gelidii]
MPITRFQSEYLSVMADIAKQAGQAIMQHYGTDQLSVQVKSDDSPVTIADMASHQVIVQGLTKLTPEVPVLSEESEAIDWETRKQWPAYWLIDPLDGTKEFIQHNGEFTVNIAYIHQGVAVAGVVYAPALGKCYSGALGFGAWLEVTSAVNQQRCSAPVPAKLSQLFAKSSVPRKVPIIVGSRSHPSPLLSDYLANLDDYEMLSVGSSLKFCLLAEGAADIYPRLGPTSEWDTAAAQAVLESAGGRVNIYDADIRLKYNQKSSLLNPFFIATSAQWK